MSGTYSGTYTLLICYAAQFTPVDIDYICDNMTQKFKPAEMEHSSHIRPASSLTKVFGRFLLFLFRAWKVQEKNFQVSKQHKV